MKNLPARLGPMPKFLARNNKPGLICASALLGVCSAIATPAFANETTMQLIEIMRDNGSISQAQYDQLRAAAVEDDRQMQTQPMQQADSQSIEDKVDAKLAKFDWASKVKLKGDIRLRYQYGDNSTRENAAGNNVSRSRGRVRYRLGIITTPLDNLEVGAGLASGGSDPRSTNQTFGDDFSSKGINLDYAYAQYEFNDYLAAIAGKFKFKNYLWVPTDLIWDGDINPEGVSARLNVDNGLGTSFVNGGLWVLNEFGSNSSDPYLYYGQLGQKFSAGNAFGTLAGTYYGYENTAQDGTFNPDYSAGTNTDDQFGVVNVSGELGTKFSGGKASLIGDYVLNTETDTDEDTGFAFGAKVGVDKWEFKYIYADLDANAVPDTFPDSDRMGGATDMKGHEVAGSYALNDAVELGLDYYNTERKSTDEDEQILQADLLVSF
ncbi:putative porin [Salinisphaera aquimarina]|uniref:Porin n=1 Tax=Salinisphaera aquimarina TaxID=2094031 RepID=A0ABV7EUM8_9GAMM